MFSLKPKDFFMGRRGPWPQPSPAHPWGESPAVIHVPFKENLDWWVWVGSRYVATLSLTPYFFLKGFLRPGLKKVSDEKFEWFINKTMISKFITNQLDDIDRGIFKDILKEGRDWYIVDLEAVKVVKTFDGIYASGSKTLLYREGDAFKVRAIYIDKTSTIFEDHDEDSWELAKYFVLQGAALCSTLVTHPIQHFPNDSINAITKSSLPKKHVLFKLLYPHLRFTLPLENAVLNYKSSLLKEKKWMVYAPYPGPATGLRELLVEGFKGIKGNASYPPFSFPMGPSKLQTSYGTYLRTYYQVFRNFVAKIIPSISPDDFWTTKWADYIHQHVPDFPKGDQIFEGDNLLEAVTSYLFTVTVGHSVDHYNYGNLDKREIPLRLRQAPPTKGAKLICRKKLCDPIDLMKYYMADTLFFSPTTVTKLIHSKYRFKDPSLKQAVKEFKNELRSAERSLIEQEIYFMPLEKIAASIQF